MNGSYTTPSVSHQHSDQSNALVRVYLNKVYLWMSIALLLTAGVATYTAQSYEIMSWVSTGFNRFLVIGGSIGIILIMIFGANRLTAGALGTLFLAYSALSGLLFGPLLVIYTQQSVGIAFACTAGTFGAMSLYGAFTKRNLSGVGRAMLMALIGLIIASLVNYFVQSSMMSFIISAAGVVIFSVLTAYDTQKLIEEGRVLEESQQGKPAILGALTLYLDFINLFIFLLRFLGVFRGEE